MLNFLWLCLLRDYNNSFFSRYSIITRLITSLINLLFYWFAAKALNPTSPFEFFSYVVIGEFILSLPLDAMSSYSLNLRSTVVEGSFELFLLQERPLWKTLTSFSLSLLFISSLSVMTNLLISVSFLNLKISLTGLLTFVPLLLCSLPFFLGLGLISAALLLYFRRGLHFFGTLTGLIGILSGVYYPITAYPQMLQNFIKIFSPFYHLLAYFRPLLNGEGLGGNLSNLIAYLLLPGILFFVMGIAVFNLSIYSYKKRGSALIFTA